MFNHLTFKFQEVKLLGDKRSGGMRGHACVHQSVSLCVYVGISVFAYVQSKGESAETAVRPFVL